MLGPVTILPIVSAAKWLSAATILALVDEGKLRLDDSVSHWLPYFKKGDKKGITVRQLLSHTSGLPSYLPCMFQAQLAMDDCAHQIAEKSKLSAAPGAEFSYGGAGYSVAGRVAEVAASASWAQIFSTRLGQPLGLQHTGYGSMPNPMLSEGQVYSSAADYVTFLQMVLDGGMHGGRRVLSEAMIEEMTRDQTAAVTGRVSPAVIAPTAWGAGATWLTRRPVARCCSRAPAQAGSCPGSIAPAAWSASWPCSIGSTGSGPRPSRCCRRRATVPSRSTARPRPSDGSGSPPTAIWTGFEPACPERHRSGRARIRSGGRAWAGGWRARLCPAREGFPRPGSTNRPRWPDPACSKRSCTVSRLIRLNLGDGFAITIVHEQRHRGQLQRIRAHAAFPASH